MSEILFYLILFILVADFIFERTLSILNIASSSKELPTLLEGVYDKDKYANQQAYFRENSRFGMLVSSFSFLLTFLILSLGGFAWLDQQLSVCFHQAIVQTLVFFAVLYFCNDLLQIPFEAYDVFSIEQRFGFNKITPKLFILDKLKAYLLTLILGGGILTVIVWIYTLSPEYFWLLAFGVIAVFTLFMSLFYSEIIVPIFNKQSPLDAGELRSEIEKFAKKAAFNLTDIYVIDGSKRSTKANAYFTGLGSKKRIVLYDTLMDKLSTEEITAVLAHEIGHYKHKHNLFNMLLALPTSLLLFLLLAYVLQSDDVAQALGAEKASFHLNALAFAILYSPISMLFGVFQTMLSRRFEYQADNFAASYGLGDALISALKKLSNSSLSMLTPHPLYVFFHYSHPTLYQRIVNIMAN